MLASCLSAEKEMVWHDAVDWRPECSRCKIAMIRASDACKWRSS
jgi:hypothetical protein